MMSWLPVGEEESCIVKLNLNIIEGGMNLGRKGGRQKHETTSTQGLIKKIHKNGTNSAIAGEVVEASEI